MKKEIVIISIIIAFIVGFFAGSEYTKYQVRTAINEGLSSIGEAFESFGESSTNNSTPEQEIIRELVPYSSSYIFTGANNTGDISIKIGEMSDKGKEYNPSDWSTFKANNNISTIMVESENVGKVGTFKSLSEYNVKLITADGYEYAPVGSEQVSNPREGYGGCVSCDSNPGEKNMEEIIFDIDFEKLKGAKLILDEDDLVEFQL